MSPSWPTRDLKIETADASILILAPSARDWPAVTISRDWLLHAEITKFTALEIYVLLILEARDIIANVEIITQRANSH